jgi:glycosyltransferase involved in cell wall biosynthesis
VPCYNQAHFLTAALDSLIGQTCTDWEALVVNDGSTDATAEVMERYARQDARIRTLHKSNGGVASALNHGLTAARGEWICWLSSDDLFLPDKLAIHQEAIRADSELRFMHTGYQFLYEETGKTESAMNLAACMPPADLQVLRFLAGNYINGISIAVHRSVFESVGGFNEEYRYGQDHDKWLRISARYRSRFLDRATCVTRIHAGQGTALFTEAGIYDSARAALEFLNEHELEALFPCLDLSQADQAFRAISAALTVAFNPLSFIARCGYSAALLDRIQEWLAQRAPEHIRLMMQQELAHAVRSLTDLDLRELLNPILKVQPGTFRYAWHDALAALKRQAARVEKRGDVKELAAMRRYLAMVWGSQGCPDPSAKGITAPESSSVIMEKASLREDADEGRLRVKTTAASLALERRSHHAPSPLVSVVIPCYMQAEYLAAAISSVALQTFRDLEIIVVDDGSPDETAQVFRSLAQRLPDLVLRLVQQPNQGVSSARNAGMAAARGRYVVPLDADDLIDPAFLEKTLAALTSNPGASIAFTDVYAFGAENQVRRMGPFDLEALRTCNRVCSTALFELAMWRNIGGYDAGMKLGYEDWDFWISCAERGHRAVHVPEPLFYYRLKHVSRNVIAMNNHARLCAQVAANHPHTFGGQPAQAAQRVSTRV